MDKPSRSRKVPLELPEPLRIARVTKRLSQEDVAAAAGTSRPAVARLEAGQQDVRISTLMSIASALGLRVSITSEAA